MIAKEAILESLMQTSCITQCKVLLVNCDGSVSINCPSEKTTGLICDILQTSERTRLHLGVGDTVLVWLPESDDEHGVVLGRIGPSHAPAAEPKNAGEAPDEMVIEAKKNLTLKCGDGSITLRKDGKILIKGKDLVSQAKRMNRIKGGSVAIN